MRSKMSSAVSWRSAMRSPLTPSKYMQSLSRSMTEMVVILACLNLSTMIQLWLS